MKVLSVILSGTFLLGLFLILITFTKWFWTILKDALADKDYLEVGFAIGVLLALPTMFMLNIGLFYSLIVR